LCEEARDQALVRLPNVIRGSDAHAVVLRAALANAGRAGVLELVRLEQRALSDVRPAGAAAGLLCTNPPYGERLGDVAAARALHAELGQVLRNHFAGWDAAILTAAPYAAQELRLRSYRVHELWNGAIPCRLLRIDLAAPGASSISAVSARAAASGGAAMFANRLEKNLRRLSRWARDSGVSCYRLYDADMPEYAFAVDRYEELAQTPGAPTLHLYVQEYAAPDSVDPEAARRRRREALSVLPSTLGVPPERIHLRVRRPQRGSAQYQPRHGTAQRPWTPSGTHMMQVAEGGYRFLVNLDDYLDTGLFLDHRLTRSLIGERAAGTRFLNLFCYTGTASVYAAAGGARTSLSLDLSNRYLDWAEANFRLNHLDPALHRLEQADCLAWLESAAHQPSDRFDLIFLDPPTFSNSKRMQSVLDIQRDHEQLIERCMHLLSPAGALLFSTNAQRFRLSEQVAARWQVQDQSRRTLPVDFARNPRIHRCYEIRPGPAPKGARKTH
jgi:23S rRNA (guanine2445-N2)-methyltransferase / 23S rRNA (guanine2069-N7)-methyltransferase